MQTFETNTHPLVEIGYYYNSSMGITAAGRSSNNALKEQEEKLFQLIGGCVFWNRPYNRTNHFYVLVPNQKVSELKELKMINTVNLSGFKTKEKIDNLIQSLENDKKHTLA